MSQDNGGAPVVHMTTTTQINQQNAVKVLEHMLVLAKEGKVAAVAVAFVKADRVGTSQAWSSSDCVPALIGAVATMQFNMIGQAINIAVAEGKKI